MDGKLSISLTRDPASLPADLLQEYEPQGKEYLGEGAFAVVRLMRHRTTGDLYALKCVEKYPLRIRNMIHQMQREVRIHQALSHPNILRLVKVFDDSGYMYMLLEYCQKGSLRTVVQESGNNRLEEPEAAFYYAQIVRGVEWMHRHSCVHRDLKLENMLLTQDDQLKICDFGWSAEVEIEKMLKTVCGTTPYWAPEIWQSEPQDEAVDLWSLGCLLYELLAGHPPFHAQDQATLGRKVLAVEFGYPPWFSNEACHAVHRLLQRDPRHRIRCAELLGHKWFEKMERDLPVGEPPESPPPPQSLEADVDASSNDGGFDDVNLPEKDSNAVEQPETGAVTDSVDTETLSPQLQAVAATTDAAPTQLRSVLPPSPQLGLGARALAPGTTSTAAVLEAAAGAQSNGQPSLLLPVPTPVAEGGGGGAGNCNNNDSFCMESEPLDGSDGAFKFDAYPVSVNSLVDFKVDAEVRAAQKSAVPSSTHQTRAGRLVRKSEPPPIGYTSMLAGGRAGSATPSVSVTEGGTPGPVLLRSSSPERPGPAVAATSIPRGQAALASAAVTRNRLTAPERARQRLHAFGNASSPSPGSPGVAGPACLEDIGDIGIGGGASGSFPSDPQGVSVSIVIPPERHLLGSVSAVSPSMATGSYPHSPVAHPGGSPSSFAVPQRPSGGSLIRPSSPIGVWSSMAMTATGAVLPPFRGTVPPCSPPRRSSVTAFSQTSVWGAPQDGSSAGSTMVGTAARNRAASVQTSQPARSVQIPVAKSGPTVIMPVPIGSAVASSSSTGVAGGAELRGSVQLPAALQVGQLASAGQAVQQLPRSKSGSLRLSSGAAGAGAAAAGASISVTAPGSLGGCTPIGSGGLPHFGFAPGAITTIPTTNTLTVSPASPAVTVSPSASLGGACSIGTAGSLAGVGVGIGGRHSVVVGASPRARHALTMVP